MPSGVHGDVELTQERRDSVIDVCRTHVGLQVGPVTGLDVGARRLGGPYKACLIGWRHTTRVWVFACYKRQLRSLPFTREIDPVVPPFTLGEGPRPVLGPRRDGTTPGPGPTAHVSPARSDGVEGTSQGACRRDDRRGTRQEARGPRCPSAQRHRRRPLPIPHSLYETREEPPRLRYRSCNVATLNQITLHDVYSIDTDGRSAWRAGR